jgi:hypothetical protein
LQVSVLAYLAVLGLKDIIRGSILHESKIYLNNIDGIMLLILLHGLLFSVYIYYRDGAYYALHSGITTVLPFLAYWYFVNRMDNRDQHILLTTIEIVMLVVAIIYSAEFVNKMILHHGSFKYSIAMNKYVIDRFGGDGVSASWVKGDIYTLVRMAGPLSHNNTTGLGIAIGFVLSFTRYLYTRKFFAFIAATFCMVTLLLTGARTAFMAAIISATIVFFLVNGIRKSVKKIYKLSYIIPFVILMGLSLINYGVIDTSAFSKIYSISNSSKTLSIMMGKQTTINLYVNQLTHNPITLFTGLGAPSQNVDYRPVLSSFSDDDIFFLSVISSYGIIIPLLLFYSLYKSIHTFIKTKSPVKRSRLEFTYVASIGCILACIISTIHTNALFRAQILPIFIIFMAFISSWQKQLCIVRNYTLLKCRRSCPS